MTFSEMNWLDRILFLKRLKTESGIEKTVTGNPIHISDALAAKIKSLTVSLSPIQDLNGQDSPYPAGGGKNKINAPDATTTGRAYLYNGALVLPAGTYTLSFTSSSGASTSASVAITDGDGNSLVSGSHAIPYTFTLTAASATVKIYVPGAGTYTNIQLEEGSSATAYAPYENICPISGRDSVTVTRTGKNLFDVSQMHLNKRYNGSDYTGESAGTFKLPPGTYTIRLNDTSVFSSVAVARSKKPYPFTLSKAELNGTVNIQTASSHMATYVIDDTYPYIYVAPSTPTATTEADFANAKIQLEIGSTPSDYEPFDGASVTVQLGQTVYGGTVDFTTGEMTVDRAMVTFDGGFYKHSTALNAFYKNNAVSNAAEGKCVSNLFKYKASVLSSLAVEEFTIDTNYTRVAFKTDIFSGATECNAYLAEHPLTVVYPLADPIIIQLTPAQLSTLKGQNNVWSDGDSVEMTYKAVAE